MNRPALFAVICLLPLIGACADTNPDASEGQAAPQLGNAVKSNIAAQTVNPLAPTESAPLAMDGERAALAQGRYAKGKVIQPDDVGVSSASGMSGGGDSGGSSSGGSSGSGSSSTTAQ